MYNNSNDINLESKVREEHVGYVGVKRPQEERTYDDGLRLDDAMSATLEHGGYLGTKRPLEERPFDDGLRLDLETSARLEHGGGFGVPQDPIVAHGTDDKEVLQNLNILKRASSVASVADMTKGFNKTTFVEILNYRYRIDARNLEDLQTRIDNDRILELGRRVNLDLQLIKTAIDSNIDFSDKPINAEYIVGKETPTDLLGLLDKYETALSTFGQDIPLIGFDDKMILNDTNDFYTAQQYTSELQQFLKTKLGITEDTMKL